MHDVQNLVEEVAKPGGGDRDACELPVYRIEKRHDPCGQEPPCMKTISKKCSSNDNQDHAERGDDDSASLHRPRTDAWPISQERATAIS